MATKAQTAPAEAIDPCENAMFPGGAHCWAYRFAFNLWIVIFLTVICVGLLNYLGVFLKGKVALFG